MSAQRALRGVESWWSAGFSPVLYRSSTAGPSSCSGPGDAPVPDRSAASRCASGLDDASSDRSPVGGGHLGAGVVLPPRIETDYADRRTTVRRRAHDAGRAEWNDGGAGAICGRQRRFVLLRTSTSPTACGRRARATRAARWYLRPHNLRPRLVPRPREQTRPCHREGAVRMTCLRCRGGCEPTQRDFVDQYRRRPAQDLAVERDGRRGSGRRVHDTELSGHCGTSGPRARDGVLRPLPEAGAADDAARSGRGRARRGHPPLLSGLGQGTGGWDGEAVRESHRRQRDGCATGCLRCLRRCRRATATRATSSCAARRWRCEHFKRQR